MRIGVDAGGTFTDFVVLRDDRCIETFKLNVVHGSTVATRVLLERKGARTAIVNLTPLPARPLVARELCFGVAERAYFDGKIAVRPNARENEERVGGGPPPCAARLSPKRGA